MDEKLIIQKIEQLRKESPKKKFSQTIDLIITLKGLDLKKTEQHLDFFTSIPFNSGKKVKTCALVGTELIGEAKEVCDLAIHVDDFEKYAKDKKAQKKLTEEYDLFIAQATVMTKIAATFGRVFGPRGKMPNPKSGSIVPPKTSLKPLVERLQTIKNIKVKKQPQFQTKVGNETMKNEEIAKNIDAIYNQMIHHLPQEKNNIKEVFVKFTMGKPIKI